LVTNRNGPPGVGKSLTAECIAEYAKKPIIPLSVGNLVAVEDSIEERLIEAFANASRLGAILLLDEADVVLEARSFEEIRINGIVSGSHTLYPKAKDAFTKIYVVFLRQLEYYSGMLFLTTNRINSMDHAFQSRIQIAIPYTELTRTQREAVWTSLLNSNLIDVTEHDKAIITENVRALSEHQLNGRQIRNTLKLAFFLALHDITSDRKVQLKHIEKALKEALQFQEFFEEGKRNSKNKNSVWKPFAPSHTGDY
jgi:SpoVK/Ycf46/Vps4 family AAA+-type ATPase